MEYENTEKSWKSKSPYTIIATSSIETEYVILANAMKKAVWLRTLLKKMNVRYTKFGLKLFHLI